LIPWAWITFYFGWQGGQAFMTMRYYSMLYGLLIMFAAWLLIRIVDCRLQIADWVGRKSTIYNLSAAIRVDWVGRKSTIYNLSAAIRWGPLVLVLLVTFGWAYAFTRI